MKNLAIIYKLATDTLDAELIDYEQLGIYFSFIRASWCQQPKKKQQQLSISDNFIRMDTNCYIRLTSGIAYY